MQKHVMGNKTNAVKKRTARLLIISMLISVFTMVIPYRIQEVKAAESTFVHPGILHTQQSIDAMKQNIANKVEPTLTAYNYLLSDGYSASDWAGRPLENVVRGGSGDNRAQMYIDIERAYHTALLWKLGAGEEYGDAAVRILNGWSSTMKSLTGNADRFLAAGIYGYQMANAAELVRDHEDFDKAAMDELLLNIFYPMNKDFLENHNTASISNYWANWDLCNIASMIAIGVFCDREDIYDEAVDYYKNGIGMGSLFNAMPYVYEEGLVQWQEAGRDQGHATLGIGLCGAINEIAWSQGDDLYGMSDNRFLKAAEYVAKYNNSTDEDADNVPYSSYTRYNSANNKYETYSAVSDAGRPAQRPVYTAIYNHYVNRMGLEAPEIEKVLYPKGADPYIEGGQRNGDEPGWQSLTFHNVSTRVEGENAEAENGSLEDGIYRFTNNKSGKTLVDNAGVLQQTEIGSMESEWWKVENIHNGEYTITNVATGRVIQTDASEYTSGSAAYTAGTNFVLGDTKTGEMNQRLAILQKGSANIYRIASAISSHVLELANANIADDATICQWRYEGGSHQEWIPEKKDTKEKLADFSFDNEEGLTGAKAKATVNGNAAFVEDAERGKVLSLSNGAWLNVTSEEGGSLLNGCKELTVSYYSKVANANTAWGFYAAADTSAQTYKKEKYIGIFEKDNQINTERYYNGRQPSASTAVETGWKHIAVVFAENSVKIYVNGVLSATADNTESIENILGSSSILQIGKANWGNGEFYDGLLDDFAIYSYAMDEKEISALAAKKQIAEFSFDDAEDGLKGAGAVAAANGSISFVEDAERGKVLSLSNQAWLDVTKADGSALLTGNEEITVSYYSKVNTANTSWGFYAAADTSTQIYKKEKYIGIYEKDNQINMERFHNGRQPSASAEVEDGWKHIAAVFASDGIKIYINGELSAAADNTESIPSILGENSVLQIGKANWGNGEFYDGLLDDFTIYNYAMDEKEIRTLSDKRLVAEFCFDDETEGFSAEEAKIIKVKNITLSDDSHSGKALKLDGNSYLKIVDAYGKSLMTGWEEMTVSYWSKVDNTDVNWMFFAAPDTSAQIYQNEVYLGALENNGTLTVERYKNSGSRAASISGTVAAGEWKHITISFEKNCTRVYVNGEKIEELESSYALPEILGENSICYIGKANWGSGEFSNALVDDVRIYNYALNDAQAASAYTGK